MLRLGAAAGFTAIATPGSSFLDFGQEFFSPSSGWTWLPRARSSECGLLSGPAARL